MHTLQIFKRNSYPADCWIVCGTAIFQMPQEVLFLFVFYLNNESMCMYDLLIKVTGMRL